MFSIIVPSYNRQAEIPALLDSLTMQSQYHFEVIIVDDCSEPAVEIRQDYPFVYQVIRNQQNLGAAASRNVGAKAAKQPWLLFLDDDDRFVPEKCAYLAQQIRQYPDINFIYHPAKCIMVNEGFSYVTQPFSDPHALTLENLLLANKIGGMPMIGIKKELFLQVGGLSTDLRALEDYEFLLKLFSHAEVKPHYVDKALSICTFHTHRKSVSTHTQYTEKAIAEIKQRYVKTPHQARQFEQNALYMLAYPHIMNLSRKAAYYYFALFRKTRSFKHLIISLVVLLSPKLAIHLKRFA
ncbi:glycosyltransferase family 2 protein [Pasteurella sp. PK-2025]|uniref:glycosyltransferase family 2 protein n=1 Tax=Pasteurella sp. PK-2025 TaxID=3413133 RepID=UPI003C768646